MLDLRLSKYFLKTENAQKLIEAIKANPGCCDGVRLNSLCKIEFHSFENNVVEHSQDEGQYDECSPADAGYTKSGNNEQLDNEQNDTYDKNKNFPTFGCATDE